MPWSYEDDIARYPELGVGAIEIWEHKLARDPARRSEQLRAAKAHGLNVSSFQADVHALFPTHLQPEPKEFHSRLRAFRAVLESCAPSLPGTAFVLNTGIAEKGDVERATRETVEAFAELAVQADALGVRLAIEPLHPLAMNEDSFLWNLEDALELVEAVNHPALGICADAWNLAGQYDLRSRIARCGTHIFLAQLSGWRRPRSFLDRLPPYQGTLDLRPFLQGLHDAGYDGPLVLEIFSQDVPDSLYREDLRAIITRSRDHLTQLLGEPPR